jgi:hypothetical protein
MVVISVTTECQFFCHVANFSPGMILSTDITAIIKDVEPSLWDRNARIAVLVHNY